MNASMVQIKESMQSMEWKQDQGTLKQEAGI